MLCRGFSRPVVAAAAASRQGVRALSSTAVRSKTPSMGDIDPSSSSVDAFHDKQKAFREKLAQAQKEHGARAFDAHKHSDQVQQSAEGSQAATGATAAASQPESDRKSGPLSNLIYGTKEGREMEAQLEASFSQVLARGKYVHSIVFHEVKPDKVDEYVKLVGDFYPKVANAPENKVHLVGSWRTEVGDCDTFGKLAFAACHTPERYTNMGRQFTSGSTKSTKDTTSPDILFPALLNSTSSTRSLIPSSTPRIFP